MKNYASWIFIVFTVFSNACAHVPYLGGPTLQSKVETHLKVSPANGRLRAKLTFKNTSASELVLSEIDAKNFSVEMNGHPLALKGGPTERVAPVKIPPHQSVETALNLESAFPFKDRLTKYKIRFESPQVRSNDVHVWY